MSEAAPPATRTVEFVTVALCTRNRANTLPDALSALLVQDFPTDSFEILVVDDASTDATPAIAQSFAHSDGRVRRVVQPRSGLSVARNRAVAEARGELVCFTDDDAVTHPLWLRAMVDGANTHPDVECFAGRLLLRCEGAPPSTCGKEALAPQFDAGDQTSEVSRAVGANMAIRRSAFEQVGLFDPALQRRGDEDNWQHRYKAAGGRIIYLPLALAWHRRLAADFHRWTMLKTRFAWGIARAEYKRETFEPLYGRAEAKAMVREVAHAVRSPCFGGLLDATMRAGLFWGVVVRGEMRKAPTTPPTLSGGTSAS